VGVIARDRCEAGTRRVLDCLEHVFPVSFELIDADRVGEVDAILLVDASRSIEADRGVARLQVASGSPAGPELHESDRVALCADARLPRPLRGRTIAECSAHGALASPAPGQAAVLARAAGRPVWWQTSSDDDRFVAVSAYPLAEIEDSGVLRDRLKSGRFMGLLPVMHFLQALVGARGWRSPPLRASFVFDDPNLHWPSYSYLDYEQLARHAVQHNYHLGLAMVPLDGWIASRRAVSLVKDNPTSLSLLMHGNDHRARELARLDHDATAEAVVAQALRRTVAFERRTGVPVQRVMVPPHEVCSKAALRAMFRLGLDGACIGQRYPWRTGATAPDVWPMTKWFPADVVEGLPILPRCSIVHARDDLALRALLGQPLILYGHHGDLADGLDLLEQAAAHVNALGDVHWSPLGEIARRNVLERREGDAMIVQLHSRSTTLTVPEDVSTLECTVVAPQGGRTGRRRLAGDLGPVPLSADEHGWTSGPIEVAPGATLLVQLRGERMLDAATVTAPRRSPWPLLRRVLAEGRDRLQPLSRRAIPRSAG
jgi:hypothetical protein